MTTTLRFPRRLGYRFSSLLFAFAVIVGCSSGEQAGDDTTSVASADSAAAAEESAASVDSASTTSPDTAAATPAATGDSIYQRPAEITLTFSGDESYAGSYRAAGTSRACGPSTFGLPGQERRFSFEFPYEGDFEIVDVSFVAEDLPAGGSTTKYSLTVALRNKKGGRPPNLSIQTDRARADDSGTATLTVRGETAELHVTGKDHYGTLDMTVRCGKRAK